MSTPRMLATIFIVLSPYFLACGDEAPGESSPYEIVVEVAMTTGDSASEPVEGALVAIDLPGGKRVETATNEEGIVGVGVDWSLEGPLAVTAFVEGRVLRSFTELDRSGFESLLAEDGRFHLRFFDEPGDLVPISGRVQNMVDESHNLTLTASLPGSTMHQEQGPSWLLRVPAGEPFTLVAAEWTVTGSRDDGDWQQRFYGWTAVDYPAVTEATTIDLDLDDRLETRRFEGTFQLPTYATSSFFGPSNLGSGFYCNIRTVESGYTLFIGAPTRLSRGEQSGTVDFELEMADLAGVTPSLWCYIQTVSRAPGQPEYVSWTALREESFLGEGVQTLALLEPPSPIQDLEHPPRPGGTVQWMTNDIDREDSAVSFIVDLMSSSGTAMHQIFVPPGVTSTFVPLPPSGIDLAELYGDEAWAVVSAVEWAGEPFRFGYWYERAAVGPPIAFAR